MDIEIRPVRLYKVLSYTPNTERVWGGICKPYHFLGNFLNFFYGFIVIERSTIRANLIKPSLIFFFVYCHLV